MFLFHIYIYWEFHNPNWRTHIFQRDRYTTKQQITISVARSSMIIWDPMGEVLQAMQMLHLCDIYQLLPTCSPEWPKRRHIYSHIYIHIYIYIYTYIYIYSYILFIYIYIWFICIYIYIYIHIHIYIYVYIYILISYCIILHSVILYYIILNYLFILYTIL